jgi:arylamine N-acetyltransferase
VDVDGYLARLGLDRPTNPTVDWLFAAQRAHAEQIPYTTIDIHVGRPGTIDPPACVDRISRTGRTGYCLQLNGAFGALLSGLGYAVLRHRGHVWSAPARELAERPLAPARELAERLFEPYPNHLALSVTVDRQRWFIDAGLGDAPYEPMPLADGAHDQGPFRYGVERISAGWRFRHDPTGSFTGMDFEDVVARQEQFEQGHVQMSTSPTSNFVTNVIASRRDATGVDKLVNQSLRRVEGARSVEWTLSSPAEFFAALADVFGLALEDLDADDRDRLWRHARAGHEAYLAAQSSPAAESVLIESMRAADVAG